MRRLSAAASWGLRHREVRCSRCSGRHRGFGGLFRRLIRQPSHQELVLDLHGRGKPQLPPEFHEAHHRVTDMAANSDPNRTGTRIGGTSHGLMRSMNAMCRSLQKKSLARARLPSSQSGELLLLFGLAGVLLDIALVLLRGRLGLARRDGLGGFIGTLLLVGHKVFPFANPKNYFRDTFITYA
jgi:hypothetical protein